MDKIKQMFSNVWVMIGSVGTLAGFIAIVWAFDNHYVAEDELNTSEARIISEMRNEAADTRLVLIEDMESRLDEYDYDISILESNGEVPPQDLVIKRNMLDRRIQRLKHNENDSSDTD